MQRAQNSAMLIVPTIPASSPGHASRPKTHATFAQLNLYKRVGLGRTTTTSTISLYLSMAFLQNELFSLVFLFVASSSLGIHARESRFFMKATRPEDAKSVPSIPPVQGLSSSGSGLHGHGQEQLTPTTTTNYDSNNYYTNNAHPNANTFPPSFPDAELMTGENYGNGDGNHFNDAGNSPSKFSNGELYSRSYEPREHNNYVDDKQYGMSDTRFLDNGRYFYDVNAERNRNRHGTYPASGGIPEAGARAGSYGGNIGAYGNIGNGNAYEYNNAMGYQNNQANREIQEEYVP